MNARHAMRRKQLGTTMIELLVALVVSVIGLLGIAAFQLRAYAAETESFQRAHASILLDDIVSRINANRTNAVAYVANNVGTVDPGDCAAAAAGAPRDLCEWATLLRGAAELSDNTAGASRIGAMTAARGCISQTANPNTFLIAIVWEGVAPTAAPATACGLNEYSDERLRRAATAVVSIANLSAI